MSFFRSLLLVAALLIAIPVSAEVPSFSDVTEDDPAYEAISSLAEEGMVKGYEDGTFRPETFVNRAEALKLIMAPLLEEDLSQYRAAFYGDVPTDAWFAPFIEAARRKNIVEGPPITALFFPSRTVTKAEFLKILLLAYDTDPNAYSEIRLPLAQDVRDPESWFYPYFRYALTAAIVTTNGESRLRPEATLTRAETARILYGFLQYRRHARSETILESAENDLTLVEAFLTVGDIAQAEQTSVRALLLARGAAASDPDGNETKAMVKVAEGFRALVRAAQSGTDGNYEEVIRRAGDAWNLADRSLSFSPAFSADAQTLKDLSKERADAARSALGAIEPKS